MSRGGARANAGRPGMPIDEKRIAALCKQGMGQQEIADRFGVPKYIIAYRIAKLKRTANAHENSAN